MNRFYLQKPNQILAWIAMMSGIQVMILWLNATFPFIGYWITYFMPFITLMVYLMVDWKGFLIYSLTYFFLTLLLIQPFIEMVLFYTLPNWILGMGYGLAFKKKTTLLSLLIILSFFQFSLLNFIQFITLQLYQLDLLSIIYQFLNLDRTSSVIVLDPILIYTVALLQVLIGLLLIFPLIERFHLPIHYQLHFSKFEFIFFNILFVFTFFSTLFFPNLGFFGLGPLALFTIYSYVYFFMKPSGYAVYILMFGLVLYPFINAILSSVLEGPYRIFSVLFLSLFPLMIGIYNSLTQKHQNALI
ncbi:MAG: hypothetical protein ACO22H_01520 [Bacilli bacterium]